MKLKLKKIAIFLALAAGIGYFTGPKFGEVFEIIRPAVGRPASVIFRSPIDCSASFINHGITS